MTGSIIERAARALAEAESGRDDWDTLDTQRQEGIRRNVCTVLHAIREPSDAMANAGAQVISAVDTTETGKAYAGEAASTGVSWLLPRWTSNNSVAQGNVRRANDDFVSANCASDPFGIKDAMVLQCRKP